MKSLPEYIKEQMRVAGKPILEDEIWTGDCYIFEMAIELDKIETGLKYPIWLDYSRAGHKPRLKYEKEHEQFISVYIDKEPTIPQDQLNRMGNKAALRETSSDFFKQLVRWIQGNRIVLLLMWDRKLYNRDVIFGIRHMDEITDEVIERENSIDIKTVDPQYYASLKHKNLPPKTLDELMDMVYTEIDKKGPNCDLNHIDTSNIKDMSGLFDGVEFTGDISKWDVSNVKDMSLMFKNSSFNGNLSDWDVSNVIKTDLMFMDSKFNQDISDWNFKKLKSSYGMFENCPIKDKFKPEVK